MGILDGYIDAGDVMDTILWELVNAELAGIAGADGGAGATDIWNGDFELDTDSDGIPDFWTDDGTTAPIYGGNGLVYPGGSIAFETTSPINGSQSIKMVHPGGAGNGGGLLESAFKSCSYQAPFSLSFVHYATAAGMNNIVRIFWYTAAQVAISSDDIYSSTTNPTAATRFTGDCRPPATAKYFTIGLIGGFTDTDVAGTAYFDDIKIWPTRLRTYDITSSIASYAFLDIRNSKRLKLTLSGVVLASTGGRVLIEASADGGSTWAGATDYVCAAMDTTGTSAGADFQILVAAGTAQLVSSSIEITDLGRAKQTLIESKTLADSTDMIHKFGGLVTTTAYNAIRVTAQTNNMTAGTLTLEEIQ